MNRITWWLWYLMPVVTWFTRHIDDPQSLRYRIGVWVVSSEWWAEDRCIGQKYYPHFTASLDRVLDGKSVKLP